MFFRSSFLTALVCLLTIFTGNAQTNVKAAFSGRIVDGQKKPVPYVTVTVLRSDNSVAGGALTEDDGLFNIEFQGTGTYSLRVSGISIDTKSFENITVTAENPLKRLGDLPVGTSATAIDEVEIVGERRMMELNVDKKVFNVEKNITTAGGSASDVLQNVPSLTVDVDGNVSLRGKSNITILIDGKPATLLGSDAASALQSLPANSIQSVEVITNPSAKYDAQGMGGIVNIVTKKDKKLGLNGNVTLGAGTRNKYNGGISLNLKNEKWNTFLNSNFRINRRYHINTTERLNHNDGYYFFSREDNQRKFDGWFNTIGAEYTFNEKNSLMLTQNINLMQWGNEGISEYDIYQNGILDSVQRRTTYHLGVPLSSSTSLDYKHKGNKPKQELSTNVTYAATWVDRKQQYTTEFYNSDAILTRKPVYQNAPGGGSNKSLNAQMDYTTPILAENGKLDFGVKTQLLWFESSNDPIIDSGDGAHIDYVLLNAFNYTQQTHAAYTSFSNQAGKWSYQGGLRLEYAYYEGIVSTLGDTSYTNDYLSLFPSVFTAYQLSKSQSVHFSYTRRTDRPSFWRLMPYLDVSNPQDTSQGNPDLRPEFIHNFELNYDKQFEKGHQLIAGIYYQYTQNLIERYRRFYSDGTTYTQFQNLNNGITYGLELTGRTQILPIWDATLNFNFFQNEINGANIDPILNNSGFSWFGKVNTNVKLPANFSLQLNGNYEAPKVAAQGTLQEVSWVDIALRKSFWKGNANIVLNVSDIFNTRKYTTVYDFSNYTQTSYRDRESRIGNITFTYRFGKSDLKSGGGRRRSQQQGGKDRDNIRTDDSGGEGGF